MITWTKLRCYLAAYRAAGPQRSHNHLFLSQINFHHLQPYHTMVVVAVQLLRLGRTKQWVPNMRCLEQWHPWQQHPVEALL